MSGRTKIILEVEETDEVLPNGNKKLLVKSHGISWPELQGKYLAQKKFIDRGEPVPDDAKMSHPEVAAHFMLTRFLEFHQERALFTATSKGLILPPAPVVPMSSFQKRHGKK